MTKNYPVLEEILVNRKESDPTYIGVFPRDDNEPAIFKGEIKDCSKDVLNRKIIAWVHSWGVYIVA